MKVSDYRRLYEAKMAARAGAGERPGAAGGLAERELLSRGSADPEARIPAIERLVRAPTELLSNVDLLLATLHSSAEPTQVREAALTALKAASFLGPRFAPFRAEYMQVLRDVAIDAEPSLREDALEVLAMEKDAYGQELLLRGLRDPAQALVPPAKAIQLLGYDVHAEFAPVVRDLLRKASDTATREEAVRLLAADPGSKALIEDLLTDRSQSGSVRALSATALQMLDPQSFEAAARKIVADDNEDDDLRATCLGALTHVGDDQQTREDAEFLRRVETLESTTPSETLRASAARFVQKRAK